MRQLTPDQIAERERQELRALTMFAGGSIVGLVLFVALLVGAIKLHEIITDPNDDMAMLENVGTTFAMILIFMTLVGAVEYRAYLYKAQKASETLLDDSSDKPEHAGFYITRFLLFLFACSQLAGLGSAAHHTDATKDDAIVSVVSIFVLWIVCGLLFERYIRPQLVTKCYAIHMAGINTQFASNVSDDILSAVRDESTVLERTLTPTEANQVYGEGQVLAAAEDKLRALIEVCRQWAAAGSSAEAEVAAGANAFTWPEGLADQLLGLNPTAAQLGHIVQYVEGIMAAPAAEPNLRSPALLQKIADSLGGQDVRQVNFSLLSMFVACRSEGYQDQLFSFMLYTLKSAYNKLGAGQETDFPLEVKLAAIERVMRMILAGNARAASRFEGGRDAASTTKLDQAYHKLLTKVVPMLRGVDVAGAAASLVSERLRDYLGEMDGDTRFSAEDDADPAHSVNFRAFKLALEQVTGDSLEVWAGRIPVPSANPSGNEGDRGHADRLAGHAIALSDSDYNRDRKRYIQLPLRMRPPSPEMRAWGWTEEQFPSAWMQERVSAYLPPATAHKTEAAQAEPEPIAMLSALLADAIARVLSCARRDSSTGPGDSAPAYWEELDTLLQALTGHELHACLKVTAADDRFVQQPRVNIAPPGTQQHWSSARALESWRTAIANHFETIEPEQVAQVRLMADCVHSLTFGEPLPEALTNASRQLSSTS